jgi:hypothetical protein
MKLYLAELEVPVKQLIRFYGNQSEVLFIYYRRLEFLSGDINNDKIFQKSLFNACHCFL